MLLMVTFRAIYLKTWHDSNDSTLNYDCTFKAPRACTYKNVHMQTNTWHQAQLWNTHTTFWKYTARSCEYMKHPLSCVVAYELTDAIWAQSPAVCPSRVISHCPWVYGNGVRIPSTPISCNYEPTERWMQGEYDFRPPGTPCRDVTGCVKLLKLSTTGSGFST